MRMRDLVLLLLGLLLAPGVALAGSFVLFETGQVRPLALSPDGTRLFAVNTPDNRLEIFEISSGLLSPIDSVPVGMEPCAVAARTNGEVWVVNHLSDTVSIVEVSAGASRVVRTLLVGDEPRDIVFAGPGGDRAFITTAHRGQHRTHASVSGVTGAGDPQLTTAGVDRADVWVFDATNPGSAIGGVPLKIITLFGDTPRALATDGSTVYAAVFHSGNQTSVVNEGSVCDGFGSASCAGDGITSPNGLSGGALPGGNPGPSTNHAAANAPEVGLVVKFDEASGEWRDEADRNWSNGIRFFLPDQDVFAIDATTLNETASFDHVGTILFNMAVNPVNGNLYVSNTDSQNLTRFEGPGVFGGTTVQGNLAQSRITVIAGGAVKPRHLNRHIDYSILPAPAGTKDHSLATPVDMAVSSDGATLYVAAFGSSKVGVFSTAELEDDSLWDGRPPAEFDPTLASASYIPVSGGGASGLALQGDQLYVFTRFDNGVSVIDLATGTEVSHRLLHNPEPASVVDGRHMLYDAFKTSSNGEASCSSCHVFGDFDSLAWDLGDPDGDVTLNPQPINIELGAVVQPPPTPINGTGNVRDFHPMKGAMTTQTLRGMLNAGHMHWRGDRSNGFFGIDAPHTNDSELSFKNFIVAFAGLVGGSTPPSDPQLQADMQLFADFMLQAVLPPNPIQNLDNSLTPSQQAGRDFYLGLGSSELSDGVPLEDFGFTCEGCHTLDPSQGFFGTNGNASFEAETQIQKIAHLRNLSQKVGMFGMPDVLFNNAGDNAHKGDQVRGTGFLHDGSTDTLFRFFQATVFDAAAFGEVLIGFQGGDPERRDVEAFVLAFPTDLAPIVGQQVTLDGGNSAQVSGRIDLMRQRAGTPFVSKILGASATECDLVVKGRVGGTPRGWLYQPASNSFVSDAAADAPLSDTALEALANTAGQELTYTCAPSGSGTRMGIDRDEDSVLDFDDPCGSFANTLPLNGGGASDPNGDPNSDGIPTECQCGDINLNGGIDLQDAIFTFNCVPPVPAVLASICSGAQEAGIADANNNGSYDLQDALVIFNAQPGGALATSSLRCPARPEGTAFPM